MDLPFNNPFRMTTMLGYNFDTKVGDLRSSVHARARWWWCLEDINGAENEIMGLVNIAIKL